MRLRNAKLRKSTCSKCGNKMEDSRIGKQAYCKDCHAEYMRKTRPKHSELTPEARFKANARAYLHVYVKRGKVKKEVCGVCGSEQSESHHFDYANPLNVIWLCNEHHLELHRQDTLLTN